jgi:hypothetical protein
LIDELPEAGSEAVRHLVILVDGRGGR